MDISSAFIIQHHHPFTNVVKVHSINIKRHKTRSCSYNFMQSSTVITTTITDSLASAKDPSIPVSSHQNINAGTNDNAALVKSTPISKDKKINNHVSSSNHFDFTYNIKFLCQSAVALCIALITSSNEVVVHAASMEPQTHQSSLEMNILPVAVEPDIVDLESLKVFRVSIGWLVGGLLVR